MENNLNEQVKNQKFIKESDTVEKSNIENLFDNFNGEYIPVDADFGEPVGKEIL